MQPYSAVGAEGPTPIRLTYATLVAKTGPCGRWPDDMTDTSENKNYFNFGCASQQNLAAQVTAFLFRRQLVFEMDARGTGLDHRLHQFVCVQHAAKSRLRVGHELSSLGEFAALLRASAPAAAQGRDSYPSTWWQQKGAATVAIMSAWQFHTREEFEQVWDMYVGIEDVVIRATPSPDRETIPAHPLAKTDRVVALGGGRTHMDHEPDLSVGFQMHVRPGDAAPPGAVQQTSGWQWGTTGWVYAEPRVSSRPELPLARAGRATGARPLSARL